MTRDDFGEEPNLTEPSSPIAPASVSTTPPWYRSPPVRWIGSGLALLVLLLFLPGDELARAIVRVPLHIWVACLLVYLSAHALGAIKWGTVVRASGGQLAQLNGLRCYYYGLFANLFLPSLVGGDVVRGALAIRLSRSSTGVVAGGLLDRLLDVASLATLALIGTLLVPRGLEDEPLVWWSVAILVGCVLAAAGGFALGRSPRVPARARKFFSDSYSAMRKVSSRPRSVAGALILAVCLQIVLIGLNALLGYFCGIRVPLSVWFFVWPIAKLSALLPFTQGGIGVREAALAGLFAPFGVAPALAVAAGLAFQAVVISGALASGCFALLLGRFSGSR